MILGENAASFYNLDVEALAPLVEQVGPTIEEVLSSATPDKITTLLENVESSGRAIASVNYSGTTPTGELVS